jgi:hypothetical protein
MVPYLAGHRDGGAGVLTERSRQSAVLETQTQQAISHPLRPAICRIQI